MQPIINLPNLYADNVQLSWGSNTTLTVAAGQMRDSTNTFDLKLSATTTIDATIVGLNGIDVGSLGANKTYAVYEISDATGNRPSGMIISLSTTAPTYFPFGYSLYRLVGYWLTDGSSHFIKGYVVGNGKYRQHYHDAGVSVLSAGTATTLTNIDLSAAVPVVDNIAVLLMADFTPTTAGDKVSFATAGSTATTLPHVTGSVAAKANSGQVKILSKLASALPTVQYINSAASGSTNVWVSGFEYFI